MRLHLAVAAVLPAIGAGRVVTIHAVTTPEADTVYMTREPAPTTEIGTVTEATTLFEASTSATTIPTGTVDTEPVSTLSAPVQQTSSYSTLELSTTLNPETYTAGFTIVSVSPSPSSAVASPSSSSSLVSSGTTLPSVTTSPYQSSSGSEISTGSLTTSPGSAELASTSSTSDSATSVVSSSSETSTSPSSSANAVSSSSATSTVASSTSTSNSVTTSPESQGTPSSAVTSPVIYSVNPTVSNQNDIFGPIETSAPPDMYTREPLKINLPEGIDQSGPLQTNKFYANVMLGGQNLTQFAQPYGVFWSQDASEYGLGVSYTTAEQRVMGPNASANPVEYYTNPLLLKSWVLGAEEFGPDNTSFTVSNQGPFSVHLALGNSRGSVVYPVALGMGSVTAVYEGGVTPKLTSQLGVKQLVQDKGPQSGTLKWTATLFNGFLWNVYASVPANTNIDGFNLQVNSNYEIVGTKTIDGLVIQVAVQSPNATDTDSILDQTAGAYPVDATVEGSVNDGTATYCIRYAVNGSSVAGAPLLYALPHHVSSFSEATSQKKTDLILNSPTKSTVTGVVSDTLEMQEQLVTDLNWLVPQSMSSDVSSSALKTIAEVVNSEISEDMKGQTDTTSTYTAGKSFDKFAYILLVASEVLGDKTVAREGMERLQETLAPWLSNTQPTPFIYDTLFKGITSSAANVAGGAPLDDFGAPYYNDHHFHYGYYVHTAAVLAMLDNKIGNGTWLEKARPFVTSLIRDVANPSTEDTYFPVSRMFDWYSGHSWAHGLFESGDGKDEESSSEDYNFAYGMKLWGSVIGDSQMEARGDLMLAIMRRSMDAYFYYKDDNTIQPADFIGNRVAGITFENKLDHTTYFGTNLEYIQGIHMLPITGASAVIRQKEFVEQEWNSLLAPIVSSLDSGWAGVLRSNQALFDASTAYQWFAQDGFKSEWLDGGASRSWYLTYAALLGGAQ